MQLYLFLLLSFLCPRLEWRAGPAAPYPRWAAHGAGRHAGGHRGLDQVSGASLFPKKERSPGWLEAQELRQEWGGASGKETACQHGRWGFDPWVGKVPWGVVPKPFHAGMFPAHGGCPQVALAVIWPNSWWHLPCPEGKDPGIFPQHQCHQIALTMGRLQDLGF